jgi:hypothetical protein
MDGRSLLAQVIREAGRLGLSSWERLALILIVALLLVMGQRGLDALKRLTLEQQVIVDENGPQPPGDGTEFGDPTNPGGGPDGGMG